MREWSIRIQLVGPSGEELPANIFEKATYKLHPSFPQPVHRTLTPPLFPSFLRPEARGLS